jgi:hypothetical protein
MTKFKRRLLWIWDYYFRTMNSSDHFRYMEVKYGQRWYDSVDKRYEEKFGD